MVTFMISQYPLNSYLFCLFNTCLLYKQNEGKNESLKLYHLLTREVTVVQRYTAKITLISNNSRQWENIQCSISSFSLEFMIKKINFL